MILFIGIFKEYGMDSGLVNKGKDYFRGLNYFRGQNYFHGEIILLCAIFWGA